MKKYGRKMPASSWWIISIAFGVVFVVAMLFYLYKGSLHNFITPLSFLPFAGLMIYSNRKGGIRITDRNILHDGACFIPVASIVSIEEDEKKGFRINYTKDSMKRFHYFCLFEKDKAAFIADLLQINPTILIHYSINQSLNYEV